MKKARRRFIKHSLTGLLAVSGGGIAWSRGLLPTSQKTVLSEAISYKYPSTDDHSVEEVVGAAHANFEKVKELVTARPELAKASWDWGFGDWESALGAASHTGRKDIAEFLIAQGARPDIFTFAMLGSIEAVKAMVAAQPGIQRTPGPHGITLMQHAQTRLRATGLSKMEMASVQEVVTYLESLGDADIAAKSLEIPEEEKSIYVGEYRADEETAPVLEVSLNSRKLLQIGRKGKFGRVMHKISDDVFAPAGAPSVRIHFTVTNGKAGSLTIHQPDPVITAIRI